MRVVSLQTRKQKRRLTRLFLSFSRGENVSFDAVLGPSRARTRSRDTGPLTHSFCLRSARVPCRLPYRAMPCRQASSWRSRESTTTTSWPTWPRRSTTTGTRWSTGWTSCTGSCEMPGLRRFGWVGGMGVCAVVLLFVGVGRCGRCWCCGAGRGSGGGGIRGGGAAAAAAATVVMPS